MKLLRDFVQPFQNLFQDLWNQFRKIKKKTEMNRRCRAASQPAATLLLLLMKGLRPFFNAAIPSLICPTQDHSFTPLIGPLHLGLLLDLPINTKEMTQFLLNFSGFILTNIWDFTEIIVNYLKLLRRFLKLFWGFTEIYFLDSRIYFQEKWNLDLKKWNLFEK